MQICSVNAVECLTFWKEMLLELLYVIHVCQLVVLLISNFEFEGGIFVPIVLFPILYLSVTSHLFA